MEAAFLLPRTSDLPRTNVTPCMVLLWLRMSNPPGLGPPLGLS
jgi:hypothetical protein